MVKERAPPKAPLRPIDGNEEHQRPGSASNAKAASNLGTSASSPAAARLEERFKALRKSDGSWTEQSPTQNTQSSQNSQNVTISQSQPIQAHLAKPTASRRSDSPDDIIEMFRASTLKDSQDNGVGAPDGGSQSQGRDSYLPTHRHVFGRPTTQVVSSLKQKAANIFLPQKTRPEHHRTTAHRILPPSGPTYRDTKPAPMQMFSSNASDAYPSAPSSQAFGEPEFYTDPAKASADLKALLEGGMDEEEEGEKKEDKEDKKDGSMEGLKVKLLPYQVEGVEWMKCREVGPVKKGKVPKGGILADDMGLGKTLQTISLILSHQKPVEGEERWKKHFKELEKTTLVVAPLSLIRQWEAEIKERVTRSHGLKVLVHHGPQRTKNFKDLALYDVVITTYQILVSEWGQSAGGKGNQVGCFGLRWWRVVLDEAHTIKNRNAKSTKACCSLQTEYRWCLTGTPMQNNLEELQSLIHFLRIAPYDDLKEWKAHIEGPINRGTGHIAIRRLHTLLRCFMKRRTKDILKVEGALNPGGKPSAPGEKSTTGFKVTERKVVSIATEFSPAERRFYERLEARTDESIQKMLKGRVNYANALVLLLRLRQTCNHPKLVEGKLEKDKDALSTDSSQKQATEDVDALADMLAGISVQTTQCDICGRDLGERAKKLGKSGCDDCLEDLAFFNQHESPERKKSKKKPNVKQVTEKVKVEVVKRSAKTKAEATESQSSKRRPRNLNRVVDSDDEEEEEGSWLVPEDQRVATKLGKAGGEEDENAEGGGEWLGDEDSRHDSEDDDDDTDLDSFVVKDPVPSKEPGDDGYESDTTFVSIAAINTQITERESQQQELEDTLQSLSASEWDYSDDAETADDDSGIDESELFGDGHARVFASSKIRELIKILGNEVQEHKFIVFSQFTSMLDLVEPFLEKEQLKFTRYDGKMRNDEREASLDRLRNDKKTRILLCSLKCGSLGLNLTAATRVVILEPFWNPFVEEQAIDRVHRLTQTIDVVVYKLTVKNTIEERILNLQERKRLLAQEAIEGGMRKGGLKLGVQELLDLFKHGDLARQTDDEERMIEGQRNSRKDLGMIMSGVQEMRKKTAARNGEHGVYGRRW